MSLELVPCCPDTDPAHKAGVGERKPTHEMVPQPVEVKGGWQWQWKGVSELMGRKWDMHAERGSSPVMTNFSKSHSILVQTPHYLSPLDAAGEHPSDN